MTPLDADRRLMLRAALIARHQWIDNHDVGPRAVEAGECDRCGGEARMVTTCGPTRWSSLGRACALEIGERAWCDGHADQAVQWLAHLAALPDDADVVARLWWVATGEVRLDPAAVDLLVHAALPAGAAGVSETDRVPSGDERQLCGPAAGPGQLRDSGGLKHDGDGVAARPVGWPRRGGPPADRTGA